MLDGPASQNVVECVEANSLIGIDLRPVLLNIERLNEFAVHQQEHVERGDIGGDVALAEVRIELLKSEVLENLLAFGLEETANLLYTSVLLEELCVLKLGTMGWVVSHEVLSKENAGVESMADAWVDFVCEEGVVL